MNARRWFSGTLAAVSAALLVLTLVWPQWIEGIFDAEPDAGGGEFELLLVLALAALAAAASADSIVAWRRARVRRRLGPDRVVEG